MSFCLEGLLIVHCCVHLSRVCMKKNTPEEGAADVQKAKASCREWVRTNRSWYVNRLCVLLPTDAQVTVVKELLRCVFLSLTSPGSLTVTWTTKLPLLLHLSFLKWKCLQFFSIAKRQ